MTNMHDCGTTINKGNNRSESMISHGNTVRFTSIPAFGHFSFTCYKYDNIEKQDLKKGTKHWYSKLRV